MVVVAELTPAQKKDLEDQQARENRRYIEEHSEDLAELRNAEQALRDRGFDPGTGRPL